MGTYVEMPKTSSKSKECENIERINYPVQMASIKKGRWRMQSFIDQGLNPKELEKEESKLWQRIKEIADNAPPPPKSCQIFPGSKLIGYGWEWATYSLPNKNQVVKVPAGIFPEVNDPEYLNNTKYAYQVCRRFIKPFVLKTIFERQETEIGPINMMFQKRLLGEQFRFIEPQKLSPKLRRLLTNLGQGLLKILEEHDWMPDMNLYQKKIEGKQVWSIWNLMLENEEPKIFDFTAYYDVYRLYPERLTQEIERKGGAWRKFLEELS